MKYNNFLNKTTNRRAYHIIRCIDQDPYPEDDYMNFHKSKGNRHRKKWRQRITNFEYRMYRTWKYNRKTKWKQIK